MVKVFCHEDMAREEFSILNHDPGHNQIRAQFFGGILGACDEQPEPDQLFPYSLLGGLLCVLRGFDVGG